MCKCTPEIKTPWCGKLGCERPVQDPPTLHDLREAKRSLDFTLEDAKRLVSEFSVMVSRALAEPKLPPTRPDLVAAFETCASLAERGPATLEVSNEALLGSVDFMRGYREGLARAAAEIRAAKSKL